MRQSPLIGTLGQVSRRVGDLDAAVAWYRDVLGLERHFHYGNLAMFYCGPTRLMLTADTEGVEPAGESILYFDVDDITDSHAELVARGVAFSAEPHLVHEHADGTQEWMAFFPDPDGHLLALMGRR